MTTHMEAARERYHVAKLALFNVRLLSALQQVNNTEINEFVTEVARTNKFGYVPPLLHQGTFLQFAYVCLVWLWESAKQTGLESELLKEFPKTVERHGVEFLALTKQINGERKLSDWAEILRLLRNALSHGRVIVTEREYIFSDYNKNRECAPTSLCLSWEQLGIISEACIYSLTPVLWEQTSE